MDKNNVKKIMVFAILALAIGSMLLFSVATTSQTTSVPAVRLLEEYSGSSFCTSNDPGCDCPIDVDPSCGP